MSKSAPSLSPLTPQEKEMIDKLSKLPRAQILQELKDNLQTAVWIELATIPIYLFGYYSIERAERSGENISPADLFANKAGGVIMSVVVEEMLHMSLSSNVLYSLGVDPQLYRHSPGPYPTPLPYHNPFGPPGPRGDTKVLIPLSRLTYEQLWHFLQIEYPEKVDTPPKDRDWDTIGQFYSYIRCLIHCPQVHDEDFQAHGADSQIQPYNYSPNNIDTAHPKQAFNPWGIPPKQDAAPNGHTGNYPTAAEAAVFSDAPDSHTGPTQLLTISSKAEALEAIETICYQGEGFEHTETDDPSHAEDSHYFKFLKLQAQLEQYPHHVEKLARLPKPPDPVRPTVTAAELAEVIVNFPDNPTTAGYDEKFRALSNVCNGVYQYMLILTETVYRVPDQQQRLFFNEAMHRSMIWVLDKLIQAMRRFELGDEKHVLAPTFENYDLGLRQDAYANLIKLTEAVTDPDQLKKVGYIFDTIKTLPDVSPYWGPGEPTPEPYPYKDAPAWPKKNGSLPLGSVIHACMGLNSCKGQDRFGEAGPPDASNPGPNACAGQGYCSTAADHTCHVQNECKNQGGCGLYGTAEELNNPGNNACKSLGSCATPINAERFSTNGKNTGKSVWARARQVFENNWDDIRTHVAGAPEKLGPAPAPFTETGPPYLWISNDNKERTNMTACGASGMSGAGGCS